MSKTPKQNITPLVCLVYNFSNVSSEIKFHVNKNTEVPYSITYNNSGVIYVVNSGGSFCTGADM